MYETGKDRLEKAGVEEAPLDARLLLEYVCGTDRNTLLAHGDREISEEECRKYEECIARREKRVPLQHITGEQEFMGITFLVNENVLIPRQDTEILVEEVLKYLKPGMHFLDLCTGSGCILLSLLLGCPGAVGMGTDLSPGALETAKRNQELLEQEALLQESDLFDQIEGVFDVIVSNPPYIKSGDIPELMEEVRMFEPLSALDGHEDGLYFYRRIVKESPAYLKAGGGLYLEIGYDQGDSVSELLRDRGFCRIEVIKDLAGLDRVVKGIYPGKI